MHLIHTSAHCPDCNRDYPAELLCRNGCVFGRVDCDKHPREHLISSDAALYRLFRDRAASPADAQPQSRQHYFLNYLSITNACNLNCTVCAARLPDEPPDRFLGLEEICRRAEAAAADGATILHLFGGEPTLHPQLPAIVEKLTAMGLNLGMVTNGLRLGRQPDLSAKLAARGLRRICLQFDSFEQETLARFKRDHLSEKLAAIDYILEADMHLGCNCIVTTDNLHELPSLLQRHLERGPALRNMTFAAAAPIGRFDITPEQTVDRERMVKALLGAGPALGFDLDDIWPLPSFPPWGLQAHPDCGVHMVFVHSPAGIRPLGYYVELARAYRLLATTGRGGGQLGMMRALLRASRPGRRREAAAAAWGIWRGDARFGLTNVGITDYRAAAFLDRQRLARCASVFHTSAGPVRGCLHYYGGGSLPGSRRYEIAHGSC